MTSDPRYPIGQFEHVGRPLTDEERGKLINEIADHPARMRSAVAGLTEEQLDTPYRDGGWTVRQVVHHVVDSHLQAYARFKLALTEDNPTIKTYDEAAWAELPHTQDAPIEGSLTILDGLHPRWVSMLRSMTPEQFRRPLHHPEVGEVTVDTLLQIYGWHCPHHEAHITELRKAEGW